MSKKKQVFLPMPLESFQRSYREKIETRSHFLSADQDEAFIGWYLKGRFAYYYRNGLSSSGLRMAGRAVPCDGGIRLIYWYRSSHIIWLYLAFVLWDVLYTLYDIFINHTVYSFSFPYGILIVLPLLAASFITSLLTRKRVDIKEMLSKKLNEVCCGMLLENRKEEAQ